MGRIMDWKLLGEQGVSKVYDTVSQFFCAFFYFLNALLYFFFKFSRDLPVTIIRPGLVHFLILFKFSFSFLIVQQVSKSTTRDLSNLYHPPPNGRISFSLSFFNCTSIKM